MLQPTFPDHVKFLFKHLWPKDHSTRLNLVASLLALGVHKTVAFAPASALGDLAASVSDINRDHHGHNSTHNVLGPRQVNPKDQERLRSFLNFVLRGQDDPRLRAIWDVAIYLAAQSVKVAANEVKSGCFAKVIGKATYNANMQGFEAIQYSALDDVLKNRSAELIAQVDRGTAAVGSAMNNLVLRCIPTCLDLALFQRRLKRNQKARQIMYGTLGTYCLWTMGYSHLRVKYRLHNATANGFHKGVLQESLANAETVKLLGSEEEETDKFSRATLDVQTTRDKVATSLSLLNAGQQLILAVGTTAALAQSVKRVYEGKADVGEVVSLGHMFHHITHPLNFLGTMYREFRTNYVAVNELISLVKRHPAVQEKPGAKPLVINKGSIAIRDVSFSYPDQDSLALDKVSLRVLGGSSIAIVGPSGSGKSTLVKLIARLYDPQQGSIEICGQDVKGVTLDSLKKSIAFVPQETVLFNDTLRYNILYGAPKDTTEAELQEAIKAAQLDTLIANLADGLDTVVGERGSRLSGGERQRVALARCFLRKPRIVILDEATSNLDAHTEKQISIAMKELQKGRTSITVAHRLSSITDVDNIVYLENGKILESGNHRELLERQGKYAALWKDQQTRGVPAYEERRMRREAAAASAAECCPTGCNH